MSPFDTPPYDEAYCYQEHALNVVVFRGKWHVVLMVENSSIVVATEPCKRKNTRTENQKRNRRARRRALALLRAQKQA